MNRQSTRLSKTVQLTTLVLALLALGATQVLAQSAWEAPADADGYQNTVKADAKSIAEGKKVYETYCKLCHGDSGKGDGPSGGSLPIKPANFADKDIMKQSDGSLAWKILTGKGAMPSWAPVLQEPQIWSVINYIRTFSK